MKKTARGFTLVELLVVIAIIAILAAIVILVIKPLELMARGRDATRLSDLTTLNNAINIAIQESTQSSSNIACNGVSSAVCGGKTTDGLPASTARAIDGTGWVKVNLGAAKIAAIPVLPVDPSNGTAYHYTYCGQGTNWVILSRMESEQQAQKVTNDGGTRPTEYEIGSVLDNAVLTCTY
jgi:prepilin-type N-terminal cleavage/methylation domain-containing protein